LFVVVSATATPTVKLRVTLTECVSHSTQLLNLSHCVTHGHSHSVSQWQWHRDWFSLSKWKWLRLGITLTLIVLRFGLSWWISHV